MSEEGDVEEENDGRKGEVGQENVPIGTISQTGTGIDGEAE